MIPALTNSEIANGVLATYDDFAQLIDGFDDTAWRTLTRCSGWEVRDVAAHVVGLTADSVSGVVGSRSPDQQAAALRDHSPAELAEQLRPNVAVLGSFITALDDAAWNGPSGVPDMTLARGVLGLWFDTWVHADDMRAALGLGEDRGPGLNAGVIFVALALTNLGWGPATLTLDGLPPYEIGAGGPSVTGDPHQFVLVGTGRADAATLGLDPTVNIYASS